MVTGDFRAGLSCATPFPRIGIGLVAKERSIAEVSIIVLKTIGRYFAKADIRAGCALPGVTVIAV